MNTIVSSLDHTQLASFNSMVGEFCGQVAYMFNEDAMLELEFLGSFCAVVRVVGEKNITVEDLEYMSKEIGHLLDVWVNEFGTRYNITNSGGSLCLEYVFYKP